MGAKVKLAEGQAELVLNMAKGLVIPQGLSRVRRNLDALLTRGFVARDGHGWQLTPDGQAWADGQT